MTAPRASTLPAYGAAILGIATFSMMDMVMKGLTIAVGIFVTMSFRSLAGLVFSGALFAARPTWPGRSAIFLHIWRGVLTTAMALLFFWGLARVPMAQAVALTFIAPLIALILASVLLGEKLGRRNVAGSLLAFAGVVIIFLGQASADMGPDVLSGSIAILGSALIYAYNIILMRQQALVARPIEIAFFQNLMICLTLVAVIPFFGTPHIAVARWPEVFLAAFLGFLSQLLLAWAYARAGAAYLSTTEYSAFLWAMLFGWLRFGEQVAMFTLVGAGTILAGCLIAARTDHPALEASA